jgi:hypothetical protein
MPVNTGKAKGGYSAYGNKRASDCGAKKSGKRKTKAKGK